MGVARRLARAITIVVLAVSAGVWAGAAAAQEPDGSRVALVIGNSSYQAVTPLPNPVNDAAAIGEAFARLGFDVTVLTDLDYVGMRRELQAFEEKVATADVAVVFYAGHGIEMGGTNFLIPVDAELKRDIHLYDEAIRLDRVLLAVEQAHLLRLVILDACRDNPFANQMELTDPSRAIGRGLALFEPTTQQDGSTILAYAARQGTIASDGDGEHSPFTTALLANLETPGLEVSFVFRNVRDDVMAATGGAQEPMITSSLGREQIFFAAAEPAAPPVAGLQNPSTTPDAGSVVVAYQAALAIDTIEAWQSFLRYYPEGLYADLARAALNKLRGESPGANELIPVAGPNEEPAEPPAVDDPGLAAIAACDRAAADPYDLDRPAEVAPVPDHILDANSRAAVEACRTAVDLNPDDRRMMAQLARAADFDRRYELAFEMASAAAGLGSAAGMTIVGAYYETGTIVEADGATAAEWYRRAADVGHSLGMLYLGYLYDVGDGVPFDLDESGRWIEAAAEAGNSEALAAIGYRYENGRGVAVDLVEARRWYLQAAEAGEGFGMQAIASMMEYGEGGPVDYAAAAGWYEQAAERGFSISMTSLGYLYENGLGVERDLETARNWYERAAAAGNAIGMFALGRFYDFGIGVEIDYELAYDWYSQSAITGEMPYALVRMGAFHDQGLGVEQNFATARSLWEEAAAAGETEALVSLGYLYEFGRGVPVDLDRASRYYIEALSLGDAYAINEFTNFADDYPGEIRREVEGFLIGEGLLAGKPDGHFDDATYAALATLAE